MTSRSRRTSAARDVSPSRWSSRPSWRGFARSHHDRDGLDRTGRTFTL